MAEDMIWIRHNHGSLQTFFNKLGFKVRAKNNGLGVPKIDPDSNLEGAIAPPLTGRDPGVQERKVM